MLTSAILGMLLALLTMLPLAWKWQLGIARVLLFVVAVSTVASALAQSFGASAALSPVVRAILVWGVTVACAVVTLAYRFYRDPERKPPGGQDVIVSPAEGEVIYVREARGGMLPVATKRGREIELEELTRTPLRHGDAVVVGIAMSFMDVHVNRAPIGGRIASQRHFPGSFGSLRSPEMVFANERMTTVIERDELQVAVVQIASRLVRQIVSFVHEGEAVVLGQRIGVIRFGSQVDLVLPLRPDVRVTVQPGTHVRAGQSVVARLEKLQRPHARQSASPELSG
jgi:phosphatidylserine decarboxylase